MNSSAYLITKLHRLLAEDARVAESAVQVAIRGRVVVLSGEVRSAEHRERMEHVVRQQLPALRIRNDILVSPSVPRGR